MLPFDAPEPADAGDAYEPVALDIPELQHGRDAYAPQIYLNGYRRNALRTWVVADRVTSVQMPGQGMVKCIDRFDTAHTYSEEAFLEFLRECAFYGCPRPSSYGSVFHSQFRSPRMRWSLQAPFAPWFAGAWQEARATGLLPGAWRQYDLNSAYLWATQQGLPNVRSMRVSRHVGRWPGMYALELVRADERLPYPFNLTTRVNATSHEIDMYQLPIKQIIGGVIWNDEIDGQPLVDAVQQFTFAKFVARSFWGRWCSTAPVECYVASGRNWELRNPIQNFIWAHLIIARVKARMWQDGGDAAHVFVDSIITKEQLQTSMTLGGWREVRVYPDGVRIKHAGFYGSPEKWERTSGSPSHRVTEGTGAREA